MRSIVFILILLLVGTGCQTVNRLNTSEADFLNLPRGEVSVTNLSFDSQTGEIKYTLPEPALVRIRIGLPEGGPLLRTLLDWEPRPVGDHLEIWDGRDDSGQVEFAQLKNLMLVLKAVELEPKAQNNSETSPATKVIRKSPEFKITFPEAKQGEDGSVLLSGLTPIKITLDPRDQEWLTPVKYEIGIYLDQIYLNEDEEGISPFTYHLDTRNLNNGTHVLTVTVVSFTGECGTKSVKLIINNKTSN